MTATVPEVDALTRLDSDWDLPCEVEGRSPTCHNHRQPAQWVVHFVICPCLPDVYPRAKLFCDPCLQYKLQVDMTECPGCGTKYQPASLAYQLIEPLRKD